MRMANISNCVMAHRVGFEKCPIPCKELSLSKDAKGIGTHEVSS